MLRNAMIRVYSLIRATERSLFPTNSAILRAACWISKRNFLDSSRIQQRPGPLDALDQIGIFQRPGHDQVHLALEEFLQLLQEPEIGIGILIGPKLIELNEEVEIAGARVKLAGSG